MVLCPSNSCCVLVGGNLKIIKNPNYGNRMEELTLEFKSSYV
jgi:hypothetical protein